MHAAIVARVAVGHGSDQAIAVSQSTQPWHVFADSGARHTRGNGVEWSPDFGWSFGFEIEAVDLAAAAVLHDENTRFRLLTRVSALASRGSRTKEFRQTEPNSTDPTELQQLSSAEMSFL
jgi:hypothetical protein